MRKTILFVLSAVAVMFVFASCTSKEDKFIADLTEYADSMEVMANNVKSEDDLNEMRDKGMEFGDKLETEYGKIELNDTNDIKEQFSKAGLDFTDEQINEIKSLLTKVATAWNTAESNVQTSAEAKESSSEDTFDDESNEAQSDTGSEDWDALLDSYDEYTTEMISYMKKISQGDESVLADYNDLIDKAKELDKKMSGARGSMTQEQWNRYLEITKRFTTEAQK